MKQCQRLKAIKAIKLTGAWNLHIIVCVALRCHGELTKDLTLKANAKATDSKFVLEEDI